MLPALPILLTAIILPNPGLTVKFPKSQVVKADVDPGLGQVGVVFLMGTDCPISRQYIPIIKAFNVKWKAEGLKNISIRFCNGPTQGRRKAVKTFIQANELYLPWRTDPGNRYARRMGAKVVPEVLVFRAGEQVYSGSIDNMFAGLGQRRAFTTEHHLDDVLEALRNGRPPEPARRTAYGCLIE
jgi:hypothetical protein